MNANAIIPGLEYAYTDWPSKNKAYYRDAKRVRVLHVYKLEPPERSFYYNRSRKVTLVECVLLEKDTGEVKRYDQYGTQLYVLSVPPRHIISTWDEHLVEYERGERERLEEDKRREQLHQEREAHYRKIEQERRAREETIRLAREKENKTIREYVSSRLGIAPDCVTILPYGGVKIDREYIKEVLPEDHAEQNVGPERGEESTTDSAPTDTFSR